MRALAKCWCAAVSNWIIHQHSPTRWVKGKDQTMLGFHWYEKQNEAVFLAMICSFYTLRGQVPYNLPEFPVPVSDSGTNVRYRPVTCWCFGFLHHQICTSATHVGIQLFPTTGRSYLQFCAQLTLQEACWLFGGLKSSFVAYSSPTLLDSWKLRDDALSTWTPRLTWSKRPSWGSSHRCWNSWCWLLLKKNEGLVIFCYF